jgi:hypothetical protein
VVSPSAHRSRQAGAAKARPAVVREVPTRPIAHRRAQRRAPKSAVPSGYEASMSTSTRLRSVRGTVNVQCRRSASALTRANDRSLRVVRRNIRVARIRVSIRTRCPDRTRSGWRDTGMRKVSTQRALKQYEPRAARTVRWPAVNVGDGGPAGKPPRAVADAAGAALAKGTSAAPAAVASRSTAP